MFLPNQKNFLELAQKIGKSLFCDGWLEIEREPARRGSRFSAVILGGCERENR